MERQQNFDGAPEIKSVKAPRLWMVYKLEMLDFHCKNVAVILTEDTNGNQEEKKRLNLSSQNSGTSKLNFAMARNFF